MLTLDQTSVLVGLGGLIYSFGFGPLLLMVLTRRNGRGKARRFLNFAAALVGAWIVNCVYRCFIEVPVNTEHAVARGDLMYDGVGGNAVTLLITGWFFPLIGCVAVHLAYSTLGCPIEKSERSPDPGPP